MMRESSSVRFTGFLSAMRITNGICGAIEGSSRSTNTPLRVDTVSDEERARLKIIIIGELTVAMGLMQMLEAYVGADALWTLTEPPYAGPHVR